MEKENMIKDIEEYLKAMKATDEDENITEWRKGVNFAFKLVEDYIEFLKTHIYKECKK